VLTVPAPSKHAEAFGIGCCLDCGLGCFGPPNGKNAKPTPKHFGKYDFPSAALPESGRSTTRCHAGRIRVDSRRLGVQAGSYLPKCLAWASHFFPVRRPKQPQAAIEAAADTNAPRGLGGAGTRQHRLVSRRALETMPKFGRFFVSLSTRLSGTARFEWRLALLPEACRIALPPRSYICSLLLTDDCLQRSPDTMQFPQFYERPARSALSRPRSPFFTTLLHKHPAVLAFGAAVPLRPRINARSIHRLEPALAAHKNAKSFAATVGLMVSAAGRKRQRFR